MSPGFDLTARWVAHTVGPIWRGGNDEAALLASCYCESLARAEEVNATSIAFPAISTGVYGYPPEPAARIAVETVRTATTAIEQVFFCCFDNQTLAIYEALLAS